MTTDAAPRPDTCPRCGGGFACGMQGAAPCPCTAFTLSPATLADLRQRYPGCLCLDCLRQLAQASASPPLQPLNT